MKWEEIYSTSYESVNVDGQAQVITKHRQETILYSGRIDDEHHGGVALILRAAELFLYGMESCQLMNPLC